MKEYHAHVYKTVGMSEVTVEAKTEDEAYKKAVAVVKEDRRRKFSQPDYKYVARLCFSFTDEEEEERKKMPYPKDSEGNIIQVDGMYSTIYFAIGIFAPVVLLGLVFIWVGKRLDTLFGSMFKT